MNVTPMHPGRWCDEHERYECTRQRKNNRGPCHGSPVAGEEKCRMHLGASAPAVIAENKLQQQAAKLLYQRDATPVTDPLSALQRLAGRAAAWEDTIGELVNDLSAKIRYSTDGGEQLRAEIAVMERAMDRLGTLLVQIAKLNIEERLAGVRKQTADMLERALDQALTVSGLDLEEQAKAREEFKRNLRVVA